MVVADDQTRASENNEDKTMVVADEQTRASENGYAETKVH